MGRKEKEGKRKPVGMAKDFEFQMPAIDAIFKLTIQVATTTIATTFA